MHPHLSYNIRMKAFFRYFLIIVSGLITGCEMELPADKTEVEHDTWEQKKMLPFTGNYPNTPQGNREGTVAFVIGNKGYLCISPFFGTTNLFSKLWEYDPKTDNWTAKADLPDGARQAPFFVIGNNAFVICNTTVWVYDATADSWTAKGTAPGADKRAGFGFAIGSKGYVSGGFYNNAEMYEYNSGANTWIRKADMPNNILFKNNDGVYRVSDARTFVIDAKAYMVGTNSYLAEYNPVNDTWKNTGIWTNDLGAYPTAFNIGNKGYLFATNKLYEFNPTTNSPVLKKGFLGQSVCYPIGFGVLGKGYVGLGGMMENNNCELIISRQLWQYIP